jgi:hypothetical protein
MNRYFFIIFWIFYLPALVAQKTIFVKSDNSGVLDGKTWPTAFNDLNIAIAAADYGDEIWVAAGNYSPSATDRSISFQLRNGVKLYGGFAGTETALTQRDWETRVTTLSGEIGQPGRTDNAYHVVYGRGLDSTTVLDGFSIRNGYSVAPFFGFNFENIGAGILLVGVFGMESKPVIRNCRIFENASNYGGGIYISWSDPQYPDQAKGRINPIIHNCVIDRNYAFNDGGGILKAGTTLGGDTFALRNCLVRNNRSKTGSGGGLYLDENGSTTLLLDNCLFEQDTAIDGGGCYFSDGMAGGYSIHFMLNRTQFVKNFAVEGAGFFYNGKAGLLLYNGNVQLKTDIQDCTFDGNRSSAGNSALFLYKAKGGTHSFKMNNTKVINNKSSGSPSHIGMNIFEYNTVNIGINHCYFDGNGGLNGNRGTPAIEVSVADFCTVQSQVTNCLFSNNEAGVVFISRKNVKMKTDITNCTFYKNQSYIFVKSWYPEYLHTDTIYNKMTINNCIVEEPQAPLRTMFYGNDPSESGVHLFHFRINYSLFSSLTEEPLAATNSPTYDHVYYGADPLFINPAANDFRLDPCSPAIGKGNNQYVQQSGAVEDLDGNSRILFKNVDLGAYEQTDSCGVSRTSEPLSESIHFQIWPNPSSDGQIAWSWSQSQNFPTYLSVTNIQGVSVYQKILNRQQSGIIDLSFLQKGVYFIQIESTQHKYTQKWIRG